MKTLPKSPIPAIALLLMIFAAGCKKENTPTPSDAKLESAKLLALNELSCTRGHVPPPPCNCQLDSSSYGLVSTFSGNGRPNDPNGTGGVGAGINPLYSIVPDAQGNLYFHDGYKIRKVSPTGAVTTYAGSEVSGSTNGYRTQATFGAINTIAIGRGGSIYASQPNERIIRKISPAGFVSTYAGGTDPATSQPVFSNPGYLVVDSHDNVYVTDNGNTSIKKIAPNGVVTTLPLKDAEGNPFRITQINGITVDAADNIFVSDGPTRTRILKITPAGVVTDLTGFTGPAYGALAFDSKGTLYIGNANNIMKMTPTGVISLLAGSTDFNNRSELDGVGTAARFISVLSLAVDKNDNLYAGDQNIIRKIVIKVTACKPKTVVK
jgi:hypothetical protein